MKAKKRESVNHLLEPLLKVPSENPFMNSRDSYDYWYCKAWNACIRTAIRTRRIPGTRRYQRKTYADWAKEDGWSEAVLRLFRVLRHS